MIDAVLLWLTEPGYPWRGWTVVGCVGWCFGVGVAATVLTLIHIFQ